MSIKDHFAVCAAIVLLIGGGSARADEAADSALRGQFVDTVQPFLRQYCLACHGQEKPEAKLDLSGFVGVEHVTRGLATWEHVLQRLAAGEMPPEEASNQPADDERQAIVRWIRAVRKAEADRHAGDPGSIPVHRLSNVQYDYTIRDLTGVDIRPTREFPVDPANEAGFDNSAESLTISPALLNKYLEAARRVVEHLVLKPHGFAFAPHPVATNTDRDKYCVKRIIEFYQRRPTDHANYFLAAWRFKHRAALNSPVATLADQAAADGISAKYLRTIWDALEEDEAEVGPLARLRSMWNELPAPNGNQPDAAREGCERMRHFVVQLRAKLEFTFPNLESPEVHKGSQPLVMWKNRQYAAHRMRCNHERLASDSDDLDLVIPADGDERARHLWAFDRFCAIFPDTFYVSERGRDYLGKPKAEQEKGRLLSAGFHSMMGYFRDDQPLYELILSEKEQTELDSLWQELDFIASAPMRQHAGFVWFERTDSRFMRDPEFDFARAEDKDVTSEAKIKRLAEVYLDKARRRGGEETALRAIADHFEDINARVRWVEQARLAAEPSHLEALTEFALRAYRRPLTSRERGDLLDFYHMLREQEGLDHEEAIQDAIVAVLMSPHFCYRMDLGTGPTIRPLTDYELASRLSYFLWASMPDAELLTRAAAGDLHQPDVLAAQTRRMLADPRVRGLATEFAGHWLDFRRFEEHNSVDRERFPQFTSELRQAMFEEPLRFFIDLVRRDGSVLEFLDARHTFVNPVLAKHYGMPHQASDPNQWLRVENAEEYGRGGLLPMSVFLTQNSPGLRTSPVKRGYWVVRRLLGEHIPAPPPNVPELPSDESQLGELTLREALAAHRDHKSCAGCHERFDAIGLVFEGYGPVGERRTIDLGGRPIDDQATFPGGSEGVGVEGLRQYLRDARQEEFLDNLCRKLLSYALGRGLMPSDDQTIEALRRTLAAHDHRVAPLIESIVTSPQFLNKRDHVQD